MILIVKVILSNADHLFSLFLSKNNYNKLYYCSISKMLPFKLKLKNESKAKDKVNRVKISERNKQLDAAVQWCKEHNCRGYAAINSGLFPLIKDRRTINNRLDETVATGNEKHYCRILTIEEETSIVRHIKNSNRCFQGLKGRINKTNFRCFKSQGFCQ